MIKTAWSGAEPWLTCCGCTAWMVNKPCSHFLSQGNVEVVYLYRMTWPCFDWQSRHWVSRYITVYDRDKIVSKDQLLGSACRSPDCGFCSSEIFRKRINRGRNESSTTHCSSSRTLFSSRTKLGTPLYNHPQAFSFHAFVPTVLSPQKTFLLPCIQDSPTSQGPTTMPASPNAFSPAGRAASLLWTFRRLCPRLSSYIFHCLQSKFTEWLWKE